MTITDSDSLRDILSTSRVIAVMGHSDDPNRTSYQIAAMLRRVGYTVYPVNPNVTEIDGQPCYPTLMDVPEPIDIVDVFRRSEFLPEVVDQAMAAKARVIWTQLGVEDALAARIAEAAGMQVVMDKCIKVEYYRLMENLV
jgi:uncharacterized protein